ncbi:MAG: response regulator transcription factor [Crocinitomicaceae bacterium]|nr:response regulator transcription factor [Flavobacteriales bacterium]NQZ36767.1 response regulator transcription factor [Crocinitomicaceae bacterium]
MIQIAIVDDHKLFRAGLINLVLSLGDEFQIQLQANHGQELLDILEKIKTDPNKSLPNLIILDVDMPIMDGFETAEHLKTLYPEIKILVLTMLQDETTLIRMLKLGIKGYLGKDVEPAELKNALLEIHNKGFHYTDAFTGRLIAVLQSDGENDPTVSLMNDRELTFLKHCCSEMTYKEIAALMFLSPKTIDGYRASLFEKLEAKSRVGLVLYAIKNGIVVPH